MADAPAEQPSDAFDSSLQYGAIVYGKAPGFYFEAADLLGWDVLEDALASFVAQHPFELVATDVLRDHLIQAAGDQGETIGALWDRWFRESHGDEDIGVEESASPPGSNLEDLLGDDANLEDLLGDGTNIDDLLGEDSPFADLLGDEAAVQELLDSGGLSDLIAELLAGG